MTLVAPALAAAAAAVLVAHPRAGLGRLPVVGGSSRRPPRGAPALPPRVAAVVAGIAVAVLVGLPAGLVPGLVVAAAGPTLLGRLEPRSARAERERLTADLPLCLDLLGACLAGGAGLEAAASAVSAAVGGPCGDRLATVAASLAVGLPPSDAWRALDGGRADDPLAPAARLLARAAEGGAPIAAPVARLAAEARADARAAGAQAARRVGVLVVAPLGLCFLPAFVLLGIVPVVIGLAAPLLATF